MKPRKITEPSIVVNARHLLEYRTPGRFLTAYSEREFLEDFNASHGDNHAKGQKE